MSAHSKKAERGGQRKNLPPEKPRPPRHRRLRCDCGQLAVTVLIMRVGTDPQYTIRMPLCPACLALEQGAP